MAPSVPTTEEAPFAAVTIATSGIHPTTARLVAMSVVFYAPSPENSALVGAEIGALTRHLNPGEDAGPLHLHGYRHSDLAQAPGFASSAELFREALDGRTLIMHQTGYTWGFIRHEFKLAQRAASRGHRGRGRGRGPRRVQPPEPVALIDTLATARRQSVECFDSRLRAIVDSYNDPSSGCSAAVVAPEGALPLVGAVASNERRAIDPDQLLEADARLTAALANAQHQIGRCARTTPDKLVADQFGVQRSHVRVDAANAPRMHVNPGKWEPGKPLVEGMEFVLSPDISSDPDELIDKGVAAGLAYSEKLNRRSSLVVCNTNHELRGKAMHAERKQIPLMDDSLFLELLDSVAAGEKEPRPVKPGTGVRPRTTGLHGPNGTYAPGRGGAGLSDARGGSGGAGGGRGKGRAHGRGAGGKGKGPKSKAAKTKAKSGGRSGGKGAKAAGKAGGKPGLKGPSKAGAKAGAKGAKSAKGTGKGSAKGQKGPTKGSGRGNRNKNRGGAQR